MRIEVGAEVLLAVEGPASGLYHLPDDREGLAQALVDEWVLPRTWPTLCGLDGALYVLDGAVRDLRACAVCRRRAGAGTVRAILRAAA